MNVINFHSNAEAKNTRKVADTDAGSKLVLRGHKFPGAFSGKKVLFVEYIFVR